MIKRMTIVKIDNKVSINGLPFEIDCSDLPSNFHAFQWYGDEGYGEEEWNGFPKPQNTQADISKYQTYVELWNEKKVEYDAFWNEQKALSGL
jgi:hypothetical protein